MANSTGSAIIYDILHLLDRKGFFKWLGKDETLVFLRDISDISNEYDCRDDEFMEDLGESLKICHGCWSYVDEMKGGLCLRCSSA